MYGFQAICADSAHVWRMSLMSDIPADWNSFWDLASPAEAAALLREFYGAGAAEAATQCAIAARNDDRPSDHQFWRAVAIELDDAPTVAQ